MAMDLNKGAALNREMKQGFQKPLNQSTSSQNQQHSGNELNPEKHLEDLRESVQANMDGLSQAGLTYAAESLSRTANNFQVQTGQINKAFQVLLDPEIMVLTGQLQAIQAIASRQNSPIQVTLGKLPLPKPQVERTVNFSRFYSESGQSERLLTQSDSSNE